MRMSFVFVLVLATAVTAEDTETLRKFIDGFRSARGRKAVELVLPAKAPAAPHGDAVLTMEYQVGHYSVSHGIVRFAPKGETVAVSRIQVGTYVPGFKRLALRGIGMAYEVSELPRAGYEALVRDLLAIRDARLKPGEGAEPHSLGWAGTSADGELRLALRVGQKDLIRVDCTLPIGGTDPDDVLRRFDDEERALLWHAWIERRLAGLPKPKPVLPDDGVAAGLLVELRVLTSEQDTARILRIKLLGSLGYADALPVLREIAQEDEEESWAPPWAHAAIAQIETQNAKDPLPRLTALLREDSDYLRDWADAALRLRYPKEYRKAIVALYDSDDYGDKRNAIAALHALDPKNATLARRAFREKAPRLRHVGARILWRLEPSDEVEAFFHAAARDKSLRSYREFHVRTGAMEFMTWGEPVGDPKRIAQTLRAILTDETDDVGARNSAALALGYLGDKGSIPALLTVFRSPVPDKPVYLQGAPAWASEDMVKDHFSKRSYLQTDDVRMAAARALGILRAREAVEPLVAFLDTPEKELEHNIRPTIATALARIGDPRARKVIERHRDAETSEEEAAYWQDRLDIIAALNGKKPAHDLLEILKDGYSDGAWIVLALAETSDRKTLEALLVSKPDFKGEIERAIRLAKR